MFGYGYGRKFRDPNSPNLERGIFKANGNFGDIEQRQALGIIDVRVDDLLISGGDFFTEYASKRMKGKFEVDRYGGNKATYLGMKIGRK